MIFPFKVELTKVLNIDTGMVQNGVLYFISDYISHEYSELTNFSVIGNTLSFDVRFWSKKASDFDGVRNGIYSLYREGDNIKLTYTYLIGGSIIYVSLLFIVMVLIGFVVNRNNLLDKSPYLISVYIIFFILIWLANLFKQNRLFKRVIKGIETKWEKQSGKSFDE